VNLEKILNISLAFPAPSQLSPSAFLVMIVFSDIDLIVELFFSDSDSYFSPYLEVSRTLTPLKKLYPSSMLLVERKSFSVDLVIISSMTDLSLWKSSLNVGRVAQNVSLRGTIMVNKL
jgi:hypothetical protein